MDFDAVLHYATFTAFLVVVPLAAGVTYFVLLLHQAVRNEERFTELQKRKGRRATRLSRLEEARRLADPFFHFNVTKAEDVNDVVQAKLARERGEVPTPDSAHAAREQKIVRAIESGRLILLDTDLEHCAPGMVLGRAVEAQGLSRGDELTAETLAQLAAAGLRKLPILYNPGRVAGALSAAAA